MARSRNCLPPGTASVRSRATDQPIVQVSPEEAAAILAEPIQAHPLNDLCDVTPPLQRNERDSDEPFLQKGQNSRAGVAKWVAWQACKMASDFGKVSDLAESIRLLAESHGYQSERKEMTVASITKMIPAGLTGGRSKNKGRSTNRTDLLFGKRKQDKE